MKVIWLDASFIFPGISSPNIAIPKLIGLKYCFQSHQYE